MEREVNKYLCLEGKLEEKVEQDVQNFLFWHQKDTFPKLVKDLDMVAETIKNKSESKEVLKKLREGSFKIWWNSITKFKPEIKYLFTQLKDKNVKCLEQHLAEKWKEDQEELEDKKEDYTKDKQEEYFEDMEEYVGPVSDEQKKKIKELYKPTWEEEKIRKTKSHDRRMAFLSQLKEARKSKETLEEWSERVLSIPHTLYKSEEVWKKEKKVQEERFYKILEVVALLDDKQRKQLIKTIEGYSKEFTNLSKRKTWTPTKKFLDQISNK